MGQGFAAPRFGVNIQAGTAPLCSTGTAVFSSSGGFDFGMLTTSTNNSFTVTANLVGNVDSISAGTTRITSGEIVFSNSNGFSFGVSGQNVTAQYDSVVYWDNELPLPTLQAFSSGTTNATNLWFQRVSFLQSIIATRFDQVVGLATQIGAVTQEFPATYTLGLAAYTMSGSTASLASSDTVSVSWTSAATAAGTTTATSVANGQTGTQWRSLALRSWSLTPGEYLFGYILSISDASSTSQYAWSIRVPNEAGTILVPGGGNLPYFGNGVYSTKTAAFPSSVHVTQIAQTNSLGAQQAPYRLAIQLAGSF